MSNILPRFTIYWDSFTVDAFSITPGEEFFKDSLFRDKFSEEKKQRIEENINFFVWFMENVLEQKRVKKNF